MSLSWLQVLLSLLGWLLLLAGCLLLNSNFASPPIKITAAGSIDVVIALLSLIRGWTMFLRERPMFVREEKHGEDFKLRHRFLGPLQLYNFGFHVALAVVWEPPEPSGKSTSTPAPIDVLHQTKLALYLAIAVTIPLFLLAVLRDLFDKTQSHPVKSAPQDSRSATSVTSSSQRAQPADPVTSAQREVQQCRSDAREILPHPTVMNPPQRRSPGRHYIPSPLDHTIISRI